MSCSTALMKLKKLVGQRNNWPLAKPAIPSVHGGDKVGHRSTGVMLVRAA
jgi:hypothetical protein